MLAAASNSASQGTSGVGFSINATSLQDESGWERERWMDMSRKTHVATEAQAASISLPPTRQGENWRATPCAFLIEQNALELKRCASCQYMHRIHGATRGWVPEVESYLMSRSWG